MIIKILRKSFWTLYDYMGFGIIINLLWLACSIPLVTLPAATGALMSLTGEMTRGKSPEVRDFFHAFKKYWKRTTGAFVIFIFVVGVLGFNIRFYMSLQGGGKLAGSVLAAVCLWALVIFALLQVHVAPMLVRTELPFKTLYRNAFILLADNPGTTIFVFVLVAGLIMFLGLSVFGLLVCLGTAVGILLNATFSVLGTKYGYEEESEEHRTWRDIFRPWE